jgi:hypothetical protein
MVWNLLFPFKIIKTDFNRITPTDVELRNSLNRWDRGIYPTWTVENPETRFPIVEWGNSEKFSSSQVGDAFL